VLYIRRNVPESPDWIAGKAVRARTSLLPVLRRHAGLTIYAVVMMAAFNFFSHGTQDLFKSFLAKERHLTLQSSTIVLICMNLAAITGGIACAALSQRIGRRRAIVLASLLALPIIPMWAFSLTPLWIGVGAVLMQLCVQGAWGVIPAHLNELSPPDVRGTFPGVTYQLGNLVAAANATLQSGLGDQYFGGDITWPLAIVVGVVALVIAVLVGFGPEARGVRMGREAHA
jgi:SHS family lactate transporter-like MFS transporter